MFAGSEILIDLSAQSSFFHCICRLVRSHSRDLIPPSGLLTNHRGLIGPARQFGTGAIYRPHLYAIIVGAFLPVPFYLFQRHARSSPSSTKHWWHYVSTPVILNGVSYIPPATGINYSSWFLVGFIFQHWIRKHAGERGYVWWVKYAYVLSSALDSGTVMGVIFIFLGMQMTKGGNGGAEAGLQWWGNKVHTTTADWRRQALKPIPESGLPWTQLLIPTGTATP